MIVVTGATGNIGRPLVRALAATGEKVTAVSRGVSAPDVPAGVRHQRGDLADPAGLKPALDGAETLFLLTTGDFVSAGDNFGGILDTARSGGVRRIVLLSSQGVGTRRHPPELEDAVRQSGLEWTMLRPGGFDSNTFLWASMVRTERLVAAPFGAVALPVIDPADIAEVAAAVLREAGHGGKVYELTGPVAISPRQQATAIGDALGEPVRFVEQSRAEARAQLVQFMPERVADTTLDILGTPSAAEQQVSPDVERVLGRPARTFAEWVTRNIAAFR
ncbi:MAG: NAD(P)H-binding protein [Kibdelosporangium sp.]